MCPHLAYQAINSSAHLDTIQRLSDLQVSQILSFTSKNSTVNAQQSLQFNAMMGQKRQSRLLSPSHPFWLTQRFQSWNTANDSTLLMIRGDHSTRFVVKDFCVNVIRQLHESKTPVIWALKTSSSDTMEAPSTIDVLRDLVSQALQANPDSHNDRIMSLRCAQFQSAQTEDQWFDLLASVLAGLPQIYVLIDIETLGQSFGDHGQDCSWPSAFQNVFNKMRDWNLRTVVKVLLVSYGSFAFDKVTEQGLRDLLISVRRQRPSLPARRNQRASSRTNPIFMGRRLGRLPLQLQSAGADYE
jgi:hypothetical protein